MKQISAPSKKRLITIARILEQKLSEQKVRITSSELSELTSWNEASIRRDISLLELHSGKSNGYSVEELKNSIEERLHFRISESDESLNCCVVGLDKIGAGFLKSSIFEKSKFKIVAGFDSNQNRIEILESDFQLYSTSQLENIIKSKKIQFALLCVSDSSAQKYAERLAAAGIKGIVNYSKTFLSIEPTVKIENANPEILLERFTL